jgi:hypothetical protein
MSSPLVDEFVGEWITRATFHDVGFRFFVGKRDGWNLFGK